MLKNKTKKHLLFRFGFKPGKFRFSPKTVFGKTEKETVLLLKDFLKTLLTPSQYSPQGSPNPVLEPSK